MAVRIDPVLFFVNRFELCLRCYTGAFALKPQLVYRGREHPRFATLECGNMHLELHGGHRGPSHKIEPVAIHFEVRDIRGTARRIKKLKGRLDQPIREENWFPQNLRVLEAGFSDPDGNQFEVYQRVPRSVRPRRGSTEARARSSRRGA